VARFDRFARSTYDWRMNSVLRFVYRNKEKVLPNVQLSKFPPLRRFRSWMRSRLKKKSVEVGGHIMFLDPNDSLDLSIDPVHEPEVTAAIQSATRPGDLAVDVGANIGYYTLVLARCVGPEGRVFAFEPDPTNFAVLKQNIEANGYKNVVAMNKALSDQAASTKLFLAPSNLADHRIFDPGDGRPSISVETVTLDDVLSDPSQKPNVIKMDVQGAEYGVLRGMKSVLSRRKDITLFAEFWPYGLFKAGVNAEEFIRLLRESGFTIYDVRSPQSPLAQERLDSLLKRSQEDNPRHLDLMCRRV
jgi:FkbM family methyltransferase